MDERACPAPERAWRAADEFARAQRMFVRGGVVIAALSGGGDSVALLRYLCSRQKALGFRVLAAHVNHGLRGAASDGDEAFARAVCAQCGVRLFVRRLTPPANAGEAWAREARYAFFERLGHLCGAQVATAHTRDDNAETVLLHLARGCAVRGAAGIPPVRGRFVRPFLTLPRAELRAALRALGQPWREDETNATAQYARGRVRNAALPALCAVHPGADAALARFAASMRDVADYLDAQAAALLEAARCGADAYDAAALCAAPAALRTQALRTLILRAGAKPEKTALCARADALLQTGGTLCIGEGVWLSVSQGQLRVCRKQTQAQKTWQAPLSPGRVAAPDGSVLEIRLLTPEMCEFSAPDAKKAFIFCADYDKIKTHSCFRTRRPGDRFAPAGRGVRKLLSKWCSEAKMPPAQRGALAVLARGSEVLWAQGFGFSALAAVGAETKTAVTITVRQMGE